MVDIFHLVWMIKRPFYRFRRFRRSVYYSITNLLMILGAAALIVGIWYLCFMR